MSTINLLPEDYIKRRTQRRSNFLCLILFAVVMTGVITAAFISERHTARTDKMRDKVEKSYDEAAKLIEQMQDLKIKRETLNNKTELTASLIERIPRSTLLGIITNARPHSTSLTQFKLTSERKQQTAKPKNRKRKTRKSSKIPAENNQDQPPEIPKPPKIAVEIELAGLAGTDVEVAKFITNLVRNELLESVDLIYSQQKVVDEMFVREFKIKMKLKNDTDALNIATKLEPKKAPWRETL